MTLTWNRQAAAAARGTVAPATLAPATSTAAGVLPQAAVPAEQRRQAAGLLRDLYDYLLANAEQHPRLAGAIPVLSSAVAEYRAGLAQDPFGGARAVYAAIEAVRRGDPSIPAA